MKTINQHDQLVEKIYKIIRTKNLDYLKVIEILFKSMNLKSLREALNEFTEIEAR